VRTRYLKTRGRQETWIADGINPASTNPALEAALRPFLSELTITQRDALRLVFWARMTERDAAEVLGIRQSSLQTRLQAAKDRLRKALISASNEETYAAIRAWLTPSETLDNWQTARCSRCGTPLAKYQANALGLGPYLLCPDCNT
jgi:predicted DNA-binding protein (UPF0251 family)